jgi:drug/metabolite transporter (DMT)-like permease
MKSRATPASWCLLSAALFGASTPVAKELLDSAGPFTLAGMLYLGAALGVLPFSFRGGSAERVRQPTHLKHLAGAVAFGGIAGPVLLLFGLQHARAASVSLWLNLETVATAVLAWLFFREHLGLRTWLAAACVVSAGALLAFPFDTGTVSAALLVGLACVCWGLDNNFTSLIDGITPAQSTLVKGIVAGVANLGIGIAVDGGLPTVSSFGIALGVGALSYGVSIMLYIKGSHLLGATRSQLLFATAPLWGVGLAWTAFGEPVVPVQVAAIAPMAIGAVLLLGGKHAHAHAHAAMTHTHGHRHDDGHHGHEHADLPAGARHTHEHRHEPTEHEHEHLPDLHHRHTH